MWYKNTKAQNFLVLFLSLLGFGSSLYFVNLKPTLDSQEKSQIEKAVFLEIFQYIIKHPDENPDYFFISVSNTDPSQELLDAFKDQRPTVEPISASTMNFGFSASIVHKNDRNKKGIKVDLKKPETTSDGNVTVIAAIYQDKRTAANYVFNLTKKDEVFTVLSVDFPKRKKR